MSITLSSFDKPSEIDKIAKICYYNTVYGLLKGGVGMYTVVDLFAGAGGLSYGFERTGQVRVIAAAEKNPDARKTYRRNHPHVRHFYEDVHDIDYQDILDDFGTVDLVIGGPPCQGFSNANRQHTTLISMNNRLVKEYVRGVLELKPKVFLMENVAMLRSQIHRFVVEETDLEMPEVMALDMRDDKLELLPREAMFDGAYELTVSASDMSVKRWSDKLITVFNCLYRYRINQAKFDKTIEKYRKVLKQAIPVFIEQEEITPVTLAEKNMAEMLFQYMDNRDVDFTHLIEVIKKPLFVQHMFERIKEIRSNNIHVFDYQIDDGALVACVKSYAVLDYIKGILGEKLRYRITDQIYNAADYGAPQKRERFIIIGISENLQKAYIPPAPEYILNPRTVRDAIEDLEDIPPFTENTMESITLPHHDHLRPLAQELRGSVLYNHICTASREVAKARFAALKEGQNFHDLDASLKTTYSNAERTQNTIYMRLNYDAPSGTVVNVRKSMWIHPRLDRAISIREAARLQTFPDSYVFEGSKDSQYQQVGNAVPPILATAIAKQILKVLSE